MELKTELLNLAKRWEEEAMEQVPDAYAVRYMHNKYFRLDNEAAGLWSCARDLRDLLIRDAEQCVHRKVGDGQVGAQEVERTTEIENGS